MDGVEHQSFANEQHLAEGAAAAVLELAQQKRSEPFTFALSGGRIAIPFYEAIVKQSQTIDIQRAWSNAHFFWADERCVPPESPDSNYSQALGSLFKPLQIPSENIHRIYGETEGSYAVTQAEAEICRVCELDGEGMPILDLVILGMGEDGHTASLFPAEPPEMMNDPAVYRAVVGTKPPPKRITLGYQPIIRARNAMVLATGGGKKQILARVFAGDSTLPLARIVKARPRSHFFTNLT